MQIYPVKERRNSHNDIIESADNESANQIINKKNNIMRKSNSGDKIQNKIKNSTPDIYNSQNILIKNSYIPDSENNNSLENN
jgi:hypothetical protein